MTASDDYYSLTSDQSSNEDRAPAARYQTPPLVSRQEAQRLEKVPPVVAPVQEESYDSETEPAEVRDTFHKVKRKPVASGSSYGTLQRPFSEPSSPTPGVDDTPYIHFAIDQLTRDEEVGGSRHQSGCGTTVQPLETSVPSKEHTTRMPPPPPIPPSDDPRLSRMS